MSNLVCMKSHNVKLSKITNSPKVVPVSESMNTAAREIKDSMTEVQKSALYLKEGKLLMDNGNFAAAIECLNEAISTNPHNSNIFAARASCYKSIQMFAEAYFDYSFLIKLEPANGVHYCSRGLCSSKLKRITLALEDLDIAVEVDPSPIHLYSRGTVHSESNNLELALKDFSRAILLQDDQVQCSEFKMRCLYSRASVLCEMKKYTAAMKDLMMILIQDPEMVRSRVLIGKTLKLTGDLERAEEQMEHVIRFESDLYSHHAELGDIRFLMRNKSKLKLAVKDFDRAIVLLEDQNARSIKAVTARVSAQARVENMRANATALKVHASDRATMSSVETSPVPTPGGHVQGHVQGHVHGHVQGPLSVQVHGPSSVFLTTMDSVEKIQSVAGSRRGSVAKKHRKCSRNVPRLRALSFCSESSDFVYSDTAPITRELVRQGQIKDMLMRKLNQSANAFPGLPSGLFSSPPIALGHVPQSQTSSQPQTQTQIQLRSSTSQTCKPNGVVTYEGGERRSSNGNSNSNNSSIRKSSSTCSRTSLTSDVIAGKAIRTLFRNSSMNSTSRRRTNGTSEASDFTDASDDNDENSDSEDEEGVPCNPTPLASRPSSPFQSILASRKAIALAMADSHEQLADILFRKSQAQLMLSESMLEDRDSGKESDEDHEGRNGVLNPGGLKGALRDAVRASEYVPDDLEYRLLVATCYLRLEDFNAAMKILQCVLDISPNNEKALFYYAFCLRALKREKEAIECLTQIISGALKERELEKNRNREKERDREKDKEKDAETYSADRDLGSIFSVPLGRVYETRGTLLLETQAYHLASADLSSALELDPSGAGNYFLRGNCHCKLGNYHEAIKDFNMAEQRGFLDLYVLTVTRGVTYRLLNRPAEALMDFVNASELLKITDKVQKVRIEMLKALCILGVRDYTSALQMMLASLQSLKKYKAAQRGMSAAPLSASMSDDRTASSSEDVEVNRDAGSDVSDRKVSGFRCESREEKGAGRRRGDKGRGSKEPSLLSDIDLRLLLRCEWVLCYHSALCAFHTGKHAKALKMINRCIEEEGVPKSRYIGIPSPHNFEENLLAYAPADAEIGACLFFKGVSLSHLDRLGEALECFLLALDSPWAVESGERKILLRFNLRDEQDRQDSVREHNRMICLFAVAKTLQREKKHLEAIEYFTKALEVLPLDKDIAFVHFRRAWSYKAVSDFTLAGDDFETAKQLKSDDPNFKLEYKRIAQCEYMEFATEPDLVEPFPPLLLSYEY